MKHSITFESDNVLSRGEVANAFLKAAYRMLKEQTNNGLIVDPDKDELVGAWTYNECREYRGIQR